MACKISWTKRAWLTYEANINYLEKEWTEREIRKFILLIERKITNISTHPWLGSSRNKREPNIRHTLVHKRVALIYKYKPLKDEIELLIFWNTSQNPKKLKLK